LLHKTFDIASARGRKRKTDERDDRLIMNLMKKDRFITAKQIKVENPDLHVSESTILRRLKQSGEFDSYWAARKPFITPENQTKRLNWARIHVTWTVEQWRRVMWSDESPFVLRYNRKKRVWRRAGERYEKECITASIKHDKKINVWGGFSATGTAGFKRVFGIMKKEQYLDILEDAMQPSADILFGGENYIFQQDNDPKHTAKVVKQWFIDNNVNVLPWPAQSPDLNPIENLWSILDLNCSKRRANNEEQLFQCLHEAWKQIPPQLCEKLVASMPARCQAVIDAKGGHTKY
jgi:hypothetical protein